MTVSSGCAGTGTGGTIRVIRYYSYVPRTALVVVFLTVLAGCYGGTRPPRIGNAAPAFTIQDSDRKVSLSDYRGKVVLLNFWATWCPPCIAEMPGLQHTYDRLRDRGFLVVGVAMDAGGSD